MNAVASRSDASAREKHGEAEAVGTVGERRASETGCVDRRSVGEQTGCDAAALFDPARVDLGRSRQLAMLLCCELTDAGYGDVGRAFGRTRGDAMRAAMRGRERRKTDPAFARQVGDVVAWIGDRLAAPQFA